MGSKGLISSLITDPLNFTKPAGGSSRQHVGSDKGAQGGSQEGCEHFQGKSMFSYDCYCYYFNRPGQTPGILQPAVSPLLAWDCLVVQLGQTLGKDTHRHAMDQLGQKSP